MFCTRAPIVTLFIVILVSACESTPKIINTGSSRPFTFTDFSFLPLINPTVLSSARLPISASTNNIQSDILAADTTNKNNIFQHANCKDIAKFSKHFPDWDWIVNPNDLSSDEGRNRALFLAEKVYVRLFSQYCVSSTNFYNQNVDESTDTQPGYGEIQYLHSDNVIITDGALADKYSFLITQNINPFGEQKTTKLYYALAQNGGEADTYYFEKLHYTDNSTLGIKRASVSRLLTDKELEVDTLPNFFHQESYVIERREQNTPSEWFDLIKFKVSRYEKNSNELLNKRHVVLEGSIIAHPKFGIHVLPDDSLSCVKNEVEEVDDLIQSCTEVPNSKGASFRANNTTNYWFSENGRPENDTNKNITCNASNPARNATQCPLKEYTNDVKGFAMPWFSFSQKTEVFYQTSNHKLLQ